MMIPVACNSPQFGGDDVPTSSVIMLTVKLFVFSQKKVFGAARRGSHLGSIASCIDARLLHH